MKRVIPCLLLESGGLYKTTQFRDARYVGDPINAVRILNEKEVDELVFLDISKERTKVGPNWQLLREIASEAFMPFAYGGGISSVEDARRVLSIGIEKVVINSALATRPEIVDELSRMCGSSSVVVSVDVRRSILGNYSVYTEGGLRKLRREPIEFAQEMERRGAGEILLTCIDREGTRSGFDLKLIESVASAVSIPLVAHGGAGSFEHFRSAFSVGASAVAAGSMFVYHGRHQAVLITYPERGELDSL